jgi:CHAT domain
VGAFGGLIEERLSLNESGDRIVSTRLTPDQPLVREEFPRPSRSEMDGYRDAIVATLSPALADEVKDHDLAEPLRAVLAKAVPMAVRKRIATATSDAPADRLVAIEITLASATLEGYPWELIGEPGVISPAAHHVVAWRSVMSSPGSLMPKQSRQSILLAGSAPMLRTSAYVADELSMIESKLPEDESIKKAGDPHLVLNALSKLLKEHRPAVFHFAAHGTKEGFQLEAEPGPTLEELNVDPETIGAELRRSDVCVAVFNCCDSATPPSPRDRTAAHTIADLSEAAVVGMAGKIQPYAAALFGSAFHASLAYGASVVEAYYQGIRQIRSQDNFTRMWSLPVLYSRTANVIPFPATDEARARRGFEQIGQHLNKLSLELADIADMKCRSAREWAEQTATASARIDCIASYMPALIGARPAASTDTVSYGRRMKRTCIELSASLSSSTTALSHLSDPRGEEAQRTSALGNLRVHHIEQQRILMNLDCLFEEAQ